MKYTFTTRCWDDERQMDVVSDTTVIAENNDKAWDKFLALRVTGQLIDITPRLDYIIVSRVWDELKGCYSVHTVRLAATSNYTAMITFDHFKNTGKAKGEFVMCFVDEKDSHILGVESVQ